MSETISMPLALDESLYDFTEEERTFFKQQTGIPDDDELKAHILQVQAEAYEVCIHELLNLVIAAFITYFILKTGLSLPLHPFLLFRKVGPRECIREKRL